MIKNNLLALGMLLIASAASATPVVFSTGLIQMGVSDSGALGGMGVGLIGPTGDAITPGCLCEGWGAAANGISAAAYAGGPAMGILTSSTSGAGSSGSTVTTLSNGLQVEQTYSSAAGGSLFNVHVNLKNISGAALSDVRYARTLDWDVSPGYFDNNYTTLYGGTPSGPGGKVLTTSTDPFALPDPMLTRSQNMNMNVTNVLGDLGSYFVFGFGNLATGASVDFDTYIGAGNTVKALLTSLGSVGVEAYSYTTGDATAGGDHAPAYGYGFAGLGLPPSLPGGDVPEPASIALLCLASGAMAWTRRRRG